jgi:Tfp pilus assembly protein PilE
VKLNKNTDGFTIIELLIVFAAILLLLGLVFFSFQDVRIKERNTERENDIKNVHGRIESYYAQKGAYPDRNDINNPEWRSNNMKALEDDAIKDPKGSKSELSDKPSNFTYSYEVFQKDGKTPCTTKENDCAVYTLTATYEGDVNGDLTFVRKNLN